MKAIQSIEKVIDYIESHYMNDISLDEIFRESHLSKFYFHRLFKEAVGMNLEKYIINRRLAYSTQFLIEGCTISDAATKCGFESGAHFSRKFKACYGITPSEYKVSQPVLFHLEKPDVMLSNLALNVDNQYVSKGMTLEIKEVKLEKFSVVGVNLECQTGIGGQGIDTPAVAWDRFHEIKETLPTITSHRHEYGISHHFSKRGYQYLAGKACEPESDSDYFVMDIEEGLYYCCTFYSETFEQAVSENLSAATGFYYSWLMDRKDHVESQYIIENYSHEAFRSPHRIDNYARINVKKRKNKSSS